jgi:hypothetical protein
LNLAVSNTRDFHVDVKFPVQLSAVSPAVIKDCRGWNECQDSIGSYLYPIQNSYISDQIYAFIKSEGRLIPLRVKEIDGKKIGEIQLDVIGSGAYGHSTMSNVAALSQHFLTRKSIDSRNKDDQEIQVEEITSGSIHTIVMSYDDRRSKHIDISWEQYFLKADIHRFYPCYEPGSYVNGFCQDEEYGYLWGLVWDDSLREVFQTKLFSGDAKDQIVVDFRNNGGGNPSLVAEFLCRVGDEKILDNMLGTHYLVKKIPREFMTHQGTVPVESLSPYQNEDFILFSDGKNEAERINFLARSGLDEKSCKEMNDPRFKDTKWIILSNGTEFSAQEIFLKLVKGSSNFKIIGSRSKGGSGSPIWFELPNTKLQVRASIARLIDESGEVIIEGKGVEPDVDSDFFSRNAFESRLIHALNVSGEVGNYGSEIEAIKSLFAGNFR